MSSARWSEADVAKAQTKRVGTPPPPQRPAPAPTVPPAHTVPADAPAVPKKPIAPWLRHYAVATYDFRNDCDRLVWTGIPKDQTNEFIAHCQRFTPTP